MANHFGVFSYNRVSIEEWVLGATLRHLMRMSTSHGAIDAEAITKLANSTVAGHNAYQYYRDTLEKVSCYFTNQRTNGSWSDFQCEIALKVFAVYVK